MAYPSAYTQNARKNPADQQVENLVQLVPAIIEFFISFCKPSPKQTFHQNFSWSPTTKPTFQHVQVRE